MKTILGIGAHYDDCVFGISGTLLKAVRKNHRVIILSLIGDYSNWKPARGREQEVIDGTVRIGKEHGVEMRFLTFAQMKYDVTETTKRVVAEAVAEIGADVAFQLWPHDRHPDHEVAAALSKVALRYADRLINTDKPIRSPRHIYQYDNGPRHTIGFEPDTFVDVTDDWEDAIRWLGKLMALVNNVPFDATTLDGAQRAKQTLALYRGQMCGVKYAEAFRAVNAYPGEVF